MKATDISQSPNKKTKVIIFFRLCESDNFYNVGRRLSHEVAGLSGALRVGKTSKNFIRRLTGTEMLVF